MSAKLAGQRLDTLIQNIRESIAQLEAEDANARRRAPQRHLDKRMGSPIARAGAGQV